MVKKTNKKHLILLVLGYMTKHCTLTDNFVVPTIFVSNYLISPLNYGR